MDSKWQDGLSSYSYKDESELGNGCLLKSKLGATGSSVLHGGTVYQSRGRPAGFPGHIGIHRNLHGFAVSAALTAVMGEQ